MDYNNSLNASLDQPPPSSLPLFVTTKFSSSSSYPSLSLLRPSSPSLFIYHFGTWNLFLVYTQRNVELITERFCFKDGRSGT